MTYILHTTAPWQTWTDRDIYWPFCFGIWFVFTQSVLTEVLYFSDITIPSSLASLFTWFHHTGLIRVWRWRKEGHNSNHSQRCHLWMLTCYIAQSANYRRTDVYFTSHSSPDTQSSDFFISTIPRQSSQHRSNWAAWILAAFGLEAPHQNVFYTTSTWN